MKQDLLIAAAALGLFVALIWSVDSVARQPSTEQAVLQMTTQGGSPRFVGYGCAGADGILWANDESDFPNCAAIERVM